MKTVTINPPQALYKLEPGTYRYKIYPTDKSAEPLFMTVEVNDVNLVSHTTESLDDFKTRINTEPKKEETKMTSQAETILKQKETQLSLALNQARQQAKADAEKYREAVKENKERQEKLALELKITKRAISVSQTVSRQMRKK